MNLYEFVKLVRDVYLEKEGNGIKPIYVLAPSGELLDILSVNFDEENDCWVIPTERE